MTDVVLHIYDVTNSGSEKTNNTIVQINKIFKDGIGLGGIFHSAVQVFGEDEWSFGFCEQGTGVFSCPAGWVNRFAHAGDAAMEVAGTTALRFRQAKTEIVTASKVAYRFLLGVTNNVATPTESSGNSNRGSPRFQGTWFKNLVTTGAKPSTSSEIENQEEDFHRQHPHSDVVSQQRQNSQSRHDI